MALRGELLSADLAAVFQMVALNQQRGRLLIRARGASTGRRRLYIEENRIQLDEEPPANPIAALLVEMGHITMAQYKGIRTRTARFQGDQRVILRDQGIIDEEVLDRVAARVESEMIMEMFLWKNISFELDEGTGSDRSCAPVFVVDHLIMEAARRSDEWEQHIAAAGLQHQVCIRTDDRDGVPLEVLSPIAQIILDHVDGLQSGDGLAEQTGLSRYHVEMALRELREAGCVRALDAGEIVAIADDCRSRGRLSDARRLYRKALSGRRRDPDLHLKLAEAEVEAGFSALGCAHRRYCAIHAEEAGDLPAAVFHNLKAIETIPTDFRPLRRLLAILGAHPGMRSPEAMEVAVGQGRRLFQFYYEGGRSEEALEVSDRLLEIAPDQQDVLGRRGRLLVSLGRTQQAVDLFLGMVRLHEKAGRLEEASNLLRQLQELHPQARHQYQAKLNGLIEKSRRSGGPRKSGRRSRWLAAAAAAGLLAYGGYAYFAGLAYDRLPASSSQEDAESAAAGDAVAARNRFLEAFPWTPAAARVRAELAAMKPPAGGSQEADPGSGGDPEALRRQWAADAERWLESGRNLIETDRVEALRAFEKAADLYARAGIAGEAAEQAKSLAESTRRSLDDGGRLIEEILAARKREDWERCHLLTVRVLKEHPALAARRDLTLPMEIRAYPEDAAIVYGNARGTGRLMIEMLPGGGGALSVQRPGFREYESPIPLSRATPVMHVILEAELPVHPFSELPVRSWTLAPGGRIVARTARGVVFYDLSLRTAVDRRLDLPRALPSWQPSVSPSGTILVSLEGGAFASYPVGESAPLFSVVHQSLSEDQPVLPPVYAGDVAILSLESPGGGGRIAALSLRDGSLLWTERLVSAPVSVVAVDGQVYCLIPSGQIIPFALATGIAREPLPGTYSGRLARDPAERLAAFRNGTGVVSIGREGSDTSVLIGSEGRCDGGPLILPLVAAATVRGSGLFVQQSPGGSAFFPLAHKAADLVAAGAGHLLVLTADQDVLVFKVAGATPHARLKGFGQDSLPPLVSGSTVLLGSRAGLLASYGLPSP